MGDFYAHPSPAMDRGEVYLPHTVRALSIYSAPCPCDPHVLSDTQVPSGEGR